MNTGKKSYRARVIDAITNEDFVSSVIDISMLPSESEEFHSLLEKLNGGAYLSPDEKKSLSDYLSAEKVLAIAKRLAIQKVEETFYSA